RQLAKAGFFVVVGARRQDRIERLAKEIDGQAHVLDVTDLASIEVFANAVPRINVLVNNAGGALGLEPIAEAKDENWQRMYDTNVLGLMRVTRAFLPKIEASGDGHIVNVGSIAGFEVYPGGAGYTAVKHGVIAITQTLRHELAGKPIRVTEIDPGMVETEFSLVRFAGNKGQADKVYEGLTPLTGDDVAEAIVWAVTRPAHVNVDQIVIKPRDQVTALKAHRRTNG
ncbi:MAG TPA: SDR family NAD(P)-dependent oxidoreductase, partial [Capsulimonadaceae bacterium]|nr:SDR family NAD(P)-dependent oxidoreductase [Capsulimonadaceae bacterium]